MKSGVKLRILTGNPTVERRDFTLGYLLFPSPIHPQSYYEPTYYKSAITQETQELNNDTASQSTTTLQVSYNKKLNTMQVKREQADP